MKSNIFRFVTICGLICAGLSMPVVAQNDGTPFSTGNNFIRLCPTKTWKLACISYTLGVYHGNQETVRNICIRPGVDGGQMYEIAMAYIRNNPQGSDNAAFAMILDSWRKEFPCFSKPEAPK
jgi:hypothetical protein